MLATPVAGASVAVDDLVERWRVRLKLRQFQAAEFVSWFLEAGLLRRVDGDRVVVTDRGRRYAALVEGAGDE